MQSLVSIAFRGMVADSVDLELFGHADAEAHAKTLADAARGLVALGRVGAGRDQAKEWGDFLDGIHIDQSRADVNLRASIPAKTIQSFVGQMMSTPRPAAEAHPSGAAPEPSAESVSAGRAPRRVPAPPSPPPSKAAPPQPGGSPPAPPPPAPSSPPTGNP